MVYVNPQPSSHELSAFYASDFWADFQKRIGQKSVEERAEDPREKKHFIRALRWLLHHHPPSRGAKLLDLGCSHGMFCRLAADAGFDAAGMEMSEDTAAFARTRMGIDVRVGPLNKQPFGRQTFSVVTMFDVLEHLANPHQEFDQIACLLPRDGTLYLAAPCRDTLEAKDVMKWSLNNPPEHLFLYAYRDVERLLRAHDFHVWAATGIYSPRMFILARHGVAPPTPFRPPPFWRWQLRETLRTVERSVRHRLRKRKTPSSRRAGD
jgi:SAM-dependent methyltransferase